MPDIPVESRSVNTTVELTVSAPYSGNGSAVDYSEPSLSVTLQSITPTTQIYGAQDVLYRVDAGEWLTLPPGGKRNIAIDFSTQTLTMKRGQFASNVMVSMTVEGVPSGLYAGDTELEGGGGSGMAEEDLPAALAGLGVYANDIRSRTVTLTKADILALHTTPFELVPAVAGSVIWPLVCCAISRGQAPYSVPMLYFDIAFGAAGPSAFGVADSRLAAQVIAQGYSIIETGPTHDFWIGATLDPYVRGQPLLMSASAAITQRTDSVLTVTIHTAGSGYAVGDILAIDQGSTLAVTSAGGGGAVTGLFVVDGSSSGIIESNKTTSAQTGSGTGCKINVTEVGNSNVTLEVTTLYRLRALPWA